MTDPTTTQLYGFGSLVVTTIGGIAFQWLRDRAAERRLDERELRLKEQNAALAQALLEAAAETARELARTTVEVAGRLSAQSDARAKDRDLKLEEIADLTRHGNDIKGDIVDLAKANAENSRRITELRERAITDPTGS